MAEAGNAKGWTFDAFEHYVERIFEERDKALKAALDANEKRLDGMNEFRGTISDQNRTLMPRSEADIRLSMQAADISALKTSRDTGSGEMRGMSVGAKVAIGLVSLFAALVGLSVAGITLYLALHH